MTIEYKKLKQNKKDEIIKNIIGICDYDEIKNICIANKVKGLVTNSEKITTTQKT